MGEHRRPPNVLQKKRWEALKSVGTRHRYIWRSQTEGTFRYPKETYGALKCRRWFKTARKFLKKRLNGRDRTEAMLNLMGVDA